MKALFTGTGGAQDTVAGCLGTAAWLTGPLSTHLGNEVPTSNLLKVEHCTGAGWKGPEGRPAGRG